MDDDRPLALLGGTLRPAPPGDAADSVLVERGRIARLGREAEIAASLPANATTIALEGRTLSPGFHDAHFHFFQTGGKASRPSLAGCRSLDDLVAAVDEAVRSDRGEGLLLLEDWDEERWSPPVGPSRRDLDRAAPDRAVIARRVCDHVAVANGRALALLESRWSGPGIDPESGLMKEEPVLALEAMFHPHPEAALRAMDAAADLCLDLGITSTADFLHPDAAASYRDTLAERRLPLRIDAYVLPPCLDRPGLLESLPRDDRFRVRGIKLFADGSIGGRTAALHEPYADRPGERGRLLYSKEEIVGLVRRARDRGLATAVHAIGDRAIGRVLDAFEAAGPGSEGDRIEHLELPRPRDLDRLRELGVRPCVQPNFLRWAEPGGLYETALGPAQMKGMNPLRTLLESGTGVFFGSDRMPPSPRFGIRCACAHPVPSQRLTEDEAHRLYTEAPADALGAETGRLREGARADLVVLPDDGERPDLTIVDGEIVRGEVPEHRS